MDIMGNKRKGEEQPRVGCEICKCKPMPLSTTHIARHNAGEKHIRLLELVEKHAILASWGIHRVEGNTVTYTCTTCNLVMPLSFKGMADHYKVQHSISKPKTFEISTLEVSKVFSMFCIYQNISYSSISYG